jgi:sugar lactone lactonase YvrE
MEQYPFATDLAVAFPLALALDAQGELWIADAQGQRLFLRDANGGIANIAGTGDEEAATVGAYPPADLLYPSGLLPSLDGVVLSEMGSGRLLKITEEGDVTSVAEGLFSPLGLARDVDDALLVADYGSGAVDRIKEGKIIDSVGLPSGRSEDDPNPINPPLPTSVAVGRDGSLYIAAPDTGTIYRLGSDGQLSTFLTAPDVSRPTGLAVTPDSRLLIADEGKNQALSVDLPAPAPLPGDADGNNRVDVSDALTGLNFLVGGETFNRRQFLALDVVPLGAGSTPPGNRRVTIQDVVRVLRLAVGLEE